MSVHLWALRLLLKLYMYAFASSQVTVRLANFR